MIFLISEYQKSEEKATESFPGFRILRGTQLRNADSEKIRGGWGDAEMGRLKN